MTVLSAVAPAPYHQDVAAPFVQLVFAAALPLPVLPVLYFSDLQPVAHLLPCYAGDKHRIQPAASAQTRQLHADVPLQLQPLATLYTQPLRHWRQR